MSGDSEPLKHLVPEDDYLDVLKARRELLSLLGRNDKYLSGKYSKNERVEPGPDFGGQNKSTRHLSAVQRYKGALYSNAPALSSWNPSDYRILILSALYGPLNPFSQIQDYNLKMDDAPARDIWKKHLPGFLKSYVLHNSISEIHLFFGTSTYYLKVARHAVEPLLEDGLIGKAIGYHVIDGSTKVTPTTHGELLEEYLKEGRIDKLPENVKAYPL